MTRFFLAIDDPVHGLLRKITRHARLYARMSSADRPPRIVYDIREGDLPDAYYSLGMLHSLGGMALDCLPQSRWRVRPEERTGIAQQVNFFDLVNLDKRCCRDLRLKPKKLGPFMVSAELLVFGTGMLRARNDDAADPLHRYLWSQHGRITPLKEIVYANIRALHRYSDQSFGIGKESFDSTNLLLGDVLGEIEQLYDRRADTAFLDTVARTLQEFRLRPEIAAYTRPPLNLMGVVELHLKRQALWKAPPVDGRAVLRRIEYILNRTTVDDAPPTLFCWRESQNVNQPPLERGGPPPDQSGYDGWLRRDRLRDDPDLNNPPF